MPVHELADVEDNAVADVTEAVIPRIVEVEVADSVAWSVLVKPSALALTGVEVGEPESVIVVVNVKTSVSVCVTTTVVTLVLLPVPNAYV